MNVVARHLCDIGKFNLDPEKSYTVPARYYTDPAIYEREKEAIFFKSWNYACHVSQVAEPGSYVTCKVADQNIAVMRGQDGVLRAFYNVCSHRAHELLTGCGKANMVTCPYHAWTYHMDGRLRTAIGQKRVEGFEAKEFGLKAVRLEEYAGFVFVNLDPKARPLADSAGSLATDIAGYCSNVPELKFAHRLTYEIKANWKNVVDNFLECYHCSVAHKAFVDLVDIKNYHTTTFDLYSSHISPPGRANNTAYKIPEGQEGNFAAWWLWPNVTFNVFPGPPNMTVLHIMPTGPETTLEHFDFFFADATPTPSEMEAIKYVDEVLQPEDIGLVESVQRGLHSRGYDQGRFMVDKERSFNSEHGLHHFHTLVLKALGDLA
jgi:phenylpropionate dioxygenase-like ring-hydroxylating dioxygenase large terminal subunit